jgi:hypothetical protein
MSARQFLLPVEDAFRNAVKQLEEAGLLATSVKSLQTHEDGSCHLELSIFTLSAKPAMVDEEADSIHGRS